MTTAARPSPYGDQLRRLRQHRRLSQLALASEAEVSSRHLSFLETGKAKPSREMVLHLAEALDVPLRERNDLLAAAGFAPVYAEHALDDAAMAGVRSVLSTVLSAHEPFPAVAVDRWWDLVEANGAAFTLLDGVAPELLAPPINVLVLSVHPDGLGRRVTNLGAYGSHVVRRLRRQVARTADPRLVALAARVEGHLAEAGALDVDDGPGAEVTLPLCLRTADGADELALFSTVSVFGAPNDVTVDDLAVEAFYPADASTEQWFRRMG